MNYQDIVEKFDRVDTALIKDESLRQQTIKLKGKRNQGGFTLLELLVVVTILAIIGGAMISSFGGQEAKAARGVATNVLAGVEDAVRIYQASAGALPNNLESLACAPFDFATFTSTPGAITNTAAPVTGITTTAAYKFGGTSNAPGIGGGLGAKLAGKFDLMALTAGATTALNDAGVTELRYAVTAACDNDAATTESVTSFGSTDAAFGDDSHFLINMDIPNQAFEDPRPDTATTLKNRGRGFSGTLAANAPIMVWNKGTLGYNNAKVGAGADDILVGMGIGQASDLVGTGTNAAFGKAPFYGQVGKDKYAHYVALVNIGNSGVDALPLTADDSYLTEGKAFVQAVVDARGDFLDEEIAEFSGQKG